MRTISEARRIDSAGALLRVPARRAEALSAIAPMLSDASAPASLKAGLIAALGDASGADVDAVLITALSRTNSTLVFDQLLKRPASSLALLAALKEGTITAAQLGPANVARLRTHPDRQVATQAAALLDSLSTAARTKADVVAALLPEVEKPGDAAKGKALFVGACSTCHKLGDIGKSDAGPPLTGIGSHPRAELLAHVVDPNREVGSQFLAMEHHHPQQPDAGRRDRARERRHASRCEGPPATWRSRRTTSPTARTPAVR